MSVNKSKRSPQIETGETRECRGREAEMQREREKKSNKEWRKKEEKESQWTD